jgi:hypothetical protein
MADRPQSFENHARFVVGYHVVTFGILVVNLLWRIYAAATAFSAENAFQLLLAIGLLPLCLYARVFPLAAQDRVIRLEMQLRLRRVLPADLQPAIDRLDVGQLVALRFASDEELPDLIRRVLADGIHDRKAIKQMVKDWQPDHLRV